MKKKIYGTDLNNIKVGDKVYTKVNGKFEKRKVVDIFFNRGFGKEIKTVSKRNKIPRFINEFSSKFFYK